MQNQKKSQKKKLLKISDKSASQPKNHFSKFSKTSPSRKPSSSHQSIIIKLGSKSIIPKSSTKNNKIKVKQQAEIVYNRYFGTHEIVKTKKKSKERKKQKFRLSSKQFQYFGDEDQKTYRKNNKLDQALMSGDKDSEQHKMTNKVMSKVIKSSDKKNIFTTHNLTSYHNLMVSNEQSQEYSSNRIKSTAEVSCFQLHNQHHNSVFVKNTIQSPTRQFQCCETFNLQSKYDLMHQSFIDNHTLADHIKKLIQQFKKTQNQNQGSIDASYFSFQSHLTAKMRAQTVDWIQSLSNQIFMKRETFHLTVSYFDRFLSLRRIKRKQLQLVAIASLITAFSFEQKLPPGFIEIFQSDQQNGFTKIQILDMEVQLAVTLKFKLCSVTMIYWVNLLTAQWDEFITQPRILALSIIQDNKNFAFSNLLHFRNERKQLYFNLIQIIDSMLFLLDSYRFSKHELVLNAIYFTLRSQCQIWISSSSPNTNNPFQYFVQKYKKTTNPIFFDKYGFNELFSEYLSLFGMQLGDIVGSSKHVYKFLNLELQFDHDHNEDVIDVQHYNQYSLNFASSLLSK